MDELLASMREAIAAWMEVEAPGPLVVELTV